MVNGTIFSLEDALLLKNVLKASLVCFLYFEVSSFVMRKDKKLLMKYAIPSKIISRIKYD